ncbi:uncharacterized protein LOC123270429 [Cotesia glomerata]|uniref:Sushi, von Willebrand factor type A, EGF and pentraxin domain-containing protein 1 n=1 Tax=Cotesia glomerata TaxID=32391 RepID=A0AAV7IJP6_COTGL|nr:uncharacterized protein LOC123270429 [Cotesia glomerata]KAH0552797.1 hypothetical protein KQX54_015429 [Cotesia glomerata]
MRPRAVVLLFLFLSISVITAESKLQQAGTVDSNDEDDDADDDDDEDDIDSSRPEVDDDGRIYKNPRNSPSAMCPRDEKQAEVLEQKCLRRCSTDEDCKSKKKKCRCDGPCGMSCIKPDRECPVLQPEMEHGKMTVTGNLFGDSAHYQCDHNYFIVGLPDRTCRADGRWSSSTPICTKDRNSFCTEPPKVSNAKHYAPVDQKGFELNSTIQYFCDYGYQTTGFQNAMCFLMEGKASWFGPDITCKPVNCNLPPDIANGWHGGECYTYDCRITYHCVDGYKLVGKPEKICLADGTWSPKEVPQCLQSGPAQCPIPENPRYGKAISTSHSYNAIVSYECNHGYVLVGMTTRKCQADRKWSDQAPVCEEINCGSPGILYNGWIENIEHGTGLGASIIFRCKGHMKLEGNTSSVCESDGKWRYPLPSCLAPCIIPRIEKGHISVATHDDHINNVTVVEHGERIYVHCIENYEFAANNTPVTCNNGTWTIIPSCTPARCKQMPKSPKNGMVIAPKMNHGMKAIFKCKDGFTQIGGGPNNSSFHVECHYGTWIGDIPHCIEVYCAFPGYVPNGKVLLVGNMGVYDYRPYVKKVPNNKQIMYDCDKGYVLNEGPTGATCVGGNWSPKELPECLPGQHPRIRWSRRRRSLDRFNGSISNDTGANLTANPTSNFKKFIDYFRRVGKKLLHLELEKSQLRDLPDVDVVKIINLNASDDRGFKRRENSNRTVDNLVIRKKHFHKKSRNKDEKMIEFLRSTYRKLKRIDSKRRNNSTSHNMTMHDILNLMSKNFFHVDLAETHRNSSHHDNLQVHNQREFTKLKREFEKIMRFYNKSLRWSEKHGKKHKSGDRNESDDSGDGDSESNGKKRNKSKNYYRGFYEFINGYVNEKLSIIESGKHNMSGDLLSNIDLDKLDLKGSTFTVGEIYAFFKHIIENKLDDKAEKNEVLRNESKNLNRTGNNGLQTNGTSLASTETTLRATDPTTSSSIKIEAINDIPLRENSTEIGKHRSKRIRNAADVKEDSRQSRKLLSVNFEGRRIDDDGRKLFTLNGLDAQQQSRSKRFLPNAELDNQIILKNLYLNAYEDEYRANVRRSVGNDEGKLSVATRRRKGNLSLSK